MQVFKSQYSPDPIQDYINKKSLRLTNEQVKLIDRTMKTPGRCHEKHFLLSRNTLVIANN